MDRLRKFPFDVVVIAFGCIAATFWLKARLGLNLADEGFRWYGTLHTALGEVPMRDFQAYEPARYYWGAFWCKIFTHNGFLALRRAECAFYFVEMSFGLRICGGRVIRGWVGLSAAGLVFWIWRGVF